MLPTAIGLRSRLKPAAPVVYLAVERLRLRLGGSRKISAETALAEARKGEAAP